MKLRNRAALGLVGLGLTVGVVALGAPAASADPAGVGVVQNHQGEAGYFVNDNGATRIRDAQSTLTVTPQIKNLNGLSPNDGALGNELCDPNSGFAVQLGVLWDSSVPGFEVEYGYGTLAPNSDPCVQSGLITGINSHIHFMNAPAIAQGDVIHLDLYFNRFYRFVKFSFCDTTQDFCRQASVHTGWQNFYEAGIGAVTNAPVLTAPAANFLDSFSGTSFNFYSSNTAFNSIYVPAHWELKRADFINGSSQVVMSSNGSLNNAGTAFTMFEGSTSP
jgi:hypothetical protein